MCKKDSNYFKSRLNAIMYETCTIEGRTKKLDSFVDELSEYVNNDNSEEIKQLQHEIKRLKKELGECYEKVKLLKQANRKIIDQENVIYAKHNEIVELKCEVADLYMQIKRLNENG